VTRHYRGLLASRLVARPPGTCSSANPLIAVRGKCYRRVLKEGANVVLEDCRQARLSPQPWAALQPPLNSPI
jgi:hypothetical protein